MKRSPVTLWRLERGLTQAELAKRIGLSGRSSICKIEERRAASPRNMAQLSKVLRVPKSILFPELFADLASSPKKEPCA